MYSLIKDKAKSNSIVHYFRFICFTILVSISLFTHAAPKAELWPYWETYNPNSTIKIDYQLWNNFLSKYVISDDKGNNLVKYADVTAKDKLDLNNFISTLTSLNPLILNRNQQFAYWVNLYNALTVQLILKNYPIKSITKLGGFFSFGPWNDKITTINGKSITLNDIEHRILRPIWRDKRIHYVVNCASMSCPNLRKKAIEPNDLNTVLSQAETEYINSSKGVKEEGGLVVLSEIYNWYSSDFGDKATLLKYLIKHLKNENLKQALSQKNVELNYQYNWALNAYP
jgi:hypothetical protein